MYTALKKYKFVKKSLLWNYASMRYCSSIMHFKEKKEEKRESISAAICSCVFSFPFKLSFIAQEQCRSHETSLDLSRFFFHRLRRQRGRGTFEFGYL